MIDFASALYLGMRHASSSLRPWNQLTVGKPAALEPVEGEQAAAAQLAALQGCGAATLGTSTLHLAWDIFNPAVLAGSAIFLDSSAYPILRWGAERASARGIAVRTFRHHDACALARALWLDRARRLRPLIATDGVCPACGKVAPLAEYLRLAKDYGGRLVVDDTQALGVLGREPTTVCPYGREGGGSLPWLGLESPEICVIASMAKGFGVPAAVVAGSRESIGDFEMLSETRVHCSPPSIAALRAINNALEMNATHGDRLRARLVHLVLYFRRALREIGLEAAGGLFPVQTLSPLSEIESARVHRRLSVQGISTVLHRGKGQGARISFLINAGHCPDQIDNAVRILSETLGQYIRPDHVVGDGCACN
jgi:8-amino-7-oxononanoate synthase